MRTKRYDPIAIETCLQKLGYMTNLTRSDQGTIISISPLGCIFVERDGSLRLDDITLPTPHIAAILDLPEWEQEWSERVSICLWNKRNIGQQLVKDSLLERVVLDLHKDEDRDAFLDTILDMLNRVEGSEPKFIKIARIK